MALKRPRGSSGTLVVLEHVSRILKGNPLGDPHVRKVGVWLPPNYDIGSKRRYPVLYDLVGFTGSGLSHVGWKSFSDNVPERAARLIHEKKMGPAIIVFPDCFTALGGNQYVNSSAIGNYADYLTREIIPFVDREFRTLASREHRGCFGKSSGAFSAAALRSAFLVSKSLATYCICPTLCRTVGPSLRVATIMRSVLIAITPHAPLGPSAQSNNVLGSASEDLLTCPRIETATKPPPGRVASEVTQSFSFAISIGSPSAGIRRTVPSALPTQS